jgi:multicomponent Na+:H+ antiporter subunit D
VLAGITTKTGVYALFRVAFTLYGITLNVLTVGWIIIVFGLITMFVGATMGLIQRDFKRLLAYSSISQVGYIILAVGVGFCLMTTRPDMTLASMNGGLFHLLNHALFKSLLFWSAGAVLYRTGTTNIDEMGGLARNMPITTGCYIVGAAAIAGIPPLNGFASKWMIYEATAAYSPVLAVVALMASVLTFAMYIKVFHSAFLGRRPKTMARVNEAPKLLLAPMIRLAVCCIMVGVLQSQVVAEVIGPATSALIDRIGYIAAALGG